MYTLEDSLGVYYFLCVSLKENVIRFSIGPSEPVVFKGGGGGQCGLKI